MKLSGLDVLYEDNHLIAVNKPGGLLVQGDDTGDPTLFDTVKEYIKVKYKKPGEVYLALLHRIDRPASGLVVFARTSKAARRMNLLFQNRKIKKTYLAIVDERPRQLKDTLRHFLLKGTFKNIVKVFPQRGRRSAQAKESILSYSVEAEIGGHVLLKVNPVTGRPHQIRAQLGFIGSPIRGDLKYGFPQRLKLPYIYLHAHEIAFEHPVKKEPIRITCAAPREQIWDLFR